MPHWGYRVQPRRFNAGTVRRDAAYLLWDPGLNLSRRFELGVKRDALLTGRRAVPACSPAPKGQNSLAQGLPWENSLSETAL
jgi:hypothetical protein